MKEDNLQLICENLRGLNQLTADFVITTKIQGIIRDYADQLYPKN